MDKIVNGVWKYRNDGDKDKFTISYDRWLLLLSRHSKSKEGKNGAHICVKLVSLAFFETYMTKYITKNEPEVAVH